MTAKRKKAKKAVKKPVKVDRKKIEAARAARFKKADKDGNGKLSRDEAPERLKKRFSQIDLNSDGQLTKEELHKAFRKHMEKKDRPKKK